MGLFWDLIQHSQISDQQSKTSSLEDRVNYLEIELRHTQELLVKTLKTLEETIGKDINGDGRVG
ncbi:hypothetical protein [Roseivirga echinicomitans]|uniref:Uncharacterized protein n=1 Tax=Roseivirga echinicomitans TaxID=296218 RepID=A0A150XVH8_9BACT|nr:hypothetical protein [Roseivirga echinicomitans]KYG82761.1 hypothetical protein AWN68_13300 [Roseivirga echinicomitans]